jgi:chorismate dehydratase
MKAKTATGLRLGRIRYLNTLPFYHGLAAPLEESGFEIEWTSGSPAEINRKMRQGKVDIAPISSLEYLNHSDDYLLLPGFCIGSRDFSASVLLLSKERIEGLDGATVSISNESLSAAALLKILLRFRFKFNNRFHQRAPDPLAMLSRFDACLIIGDEALFFRPKEFVYKNDLSELWWNWTERPFCFSLWAVRRSYYREHSDGVAQFCRRLRGRVEKNLLDLERLIREGLGLTLADEKFATVFGYLFNLSYGLDAPMQEGLQLFFQLAHRLGISPRPKKLEFVKL